VANGLIQSRRLQILECCLLSLHLIGSGKSLLGLFDLARKLIFLAEENFMHPLDKKPLSSTNLPKLLEIIAMMVSLIMVCYHFISTQYLFLDIQQHQNMHLIFAFTLVILVSLRQKCNSQPHGI